MPPVFYASRGTWTLAALLLLLLGSGAPALGAQEESAAAGPPYRVGGDVKRPEKISGGPAAYTDEARKARVAGTVVLETLIDEQGNVTDARVIKGLPMGLTEAAQEAVRAWKFKPATLDGRPVPVYYALTVNFQIEAPPEGASAEGTERPEKISGDFPKISRKARKAGVSGSVVVEALIDEQGKVQDARIVKGLHEDLDREALKAIRTWKFKPATFNGKPVKVHYSTTFNFR